MVAHFLSCLVNQLLKWFNWIKKNVCTHRNVPVVRCSHRVRQPRQRSPEERGGAEGAWRVRAHQIIEWPFTIKALQGTSLADRGPEGVRLTFQSPQNWRKRKILLSCSFFQKVWRLSSCKTAPAGGSYFCLRQMTIKVDVIWLKLNLLLDKTLQLNKNLHDDTYSTKITKNKP